jgi:PBP1b-binding outer membrane lipoprotein LpoB
MKQAATVLFALVFIAGCSSSKPAPKPFTWESKTSTADAQKKEKQAELQDPCSAQNLKTASEEQKKKCDPTKGMFDNVKPNQPDQSSPKQPPRVASKKS